MKPDGMQDLVRIADAVFVAEQAKLRDILEVEGRLRRSIVALTEHLSATATSAAESRSVTPSRASGADIVWRVHARQQLAELNLSLARVLAAKQPRMEGLRSAFGRKEALRLLTQRAR